MKNIAIRILIISLAAVVAMGCKSDLNFKEYQVTPIGGLTAPANNYFVELVAGEGQFVYFQWEPAKTENGILPTYEVVFYKSQGGPEIFRYDAGLYSYANISHKNMNKIADLADIDAESEGGDMYWSVIANLGIKQSGSDEVRKLALKRLAGFSYIPDVLYIAGSATEAEELEMEMLPMKKTDDDGEFEIYTKLNETGTYSFVDDEGTVYTYANRLMEYGDDPITISKTGVYRVKVDMSTKTIKWTEIVQVQYCLQHLLSENEVLPYIGNGVWKVEDKLIKFATDTWGHEERFRFNVTVEGEDYAQEIWGQRDDNREVRPESIAAEPTFWYLYIRPRTGINDYSYTWKFPLEVKDSYVDLSAIMTATEDNYRVEIVLK